MANNPSQKHMVCEKTKRVHYLFSCSMFLLLKKGWIDLIAKMAQLGPPSSQTRKKEKKKFAFESRGHPGPRSY